MDSEIYRELREAGVPIGEVSNLARIARELSEMSPGEPDRVWLEESKARLLERFASPQQEQPASGMEPSD